MEATGNERERDYYVTDSIYVKEHAVDLFLLRIWEVVVSDLGLRSYLLADVLHAFSYSARHMRG
jgi:hypothetical protein